jgi:hypothetical protein
MEDTNLQIVLVEGRDVSQIRESPAQIVHILKREAVRAMEIKRLDI